jgi:predicted oxidoreductase
MDFSPIIIGTMRWGVWGANLSAKEVQRLIEESLTQGFYTFDHADIYGGYTTEALYGEAVSEMNLPRESYQLISKCGIEYMGGTKNYSIKSYNYSKDYILNCVDESLQNLKTDYLDVLLLHRPSPLMDPEEIAAAFGILRSNGKVRDFGVSNFSASQFNLIHQYFPFLVTNQVEISVNNTGAFYDGTLDQMMIKKLKPMAWSVLGDYFTVGSRQNERIREVIEPLCSTYGAQENQLLISFLLKHPAGIIPIVGTSKADNIAKFKKALDISLDRTDWFRILEASAGRKVP